MILIIGAGMTGLACARELVAHGREVLVVDKGRGPGGRLSTRRRDDLAFDHGAQYFRIRDRRLLPTLARLRATGAVQPWRGQIVALRNGIATAREEDGTRYVGVPGMSAVARALGEGLPLRCGLRIAGLQRDGGAWRPVAEDGSALPERADTVIVATPAAQAVPLLATAPALAARAGAVEVDPCWAAMAAFPARLPLDYDGAFVSDGPLAWVARNASKPGRAAAECWVLHGGPAWSSAHLADDADTVAAALLAAFATATGIDPGRPDHLAAHRWRYAKTRTAAGEACLWDAAQRLGACGDWCLGASVEQALLSGRAMAERLL